MVLKENELLDWAARTVIPVHHPLPIRSGGQPALLISRCECKLTVLLNNF